MKKSILATVVALGLVSGMAHAADEVQFVGSVTSTTCEIIPSVNGVNNGAAQEVIQLGAVKVNGQGDAVDFVFKPSAATDNAASCDAMLDTGVVTMTWTGNYFNGNGLGIATGAAKDARVEIKPVNAKADNGTAILASATSNEFDPAKLKTGGEGLKYTAQLFGGATPGDFQTAAKFNFSYK
ncbi:TPA: fimbrial protein [Salmonella enterica]|uniref:Fimbrial protein n=1 Tax=Salmonella enterica TaxID=28901 RepID=A0A763MYR3_SALER|nr:fimbrial protein [Salmonella enterica]HAG4424230.1 fimbrial protein [Salmonella enterica]